MNGVVMEALAGTLSHPLTLRELHVLQGMADGRTNLEIGAGLYISEDTVKTHARRMFKKLGARDRAHAVAIGMRRRLLDLEPEPPTGRPSSELLTQAAALLNKAASLERSVGDKRLAEKLTEHAGKLLRVAQGPEPDGER